MLHVQAFATPEIFLEDYVELEKKLAQIPFLIQHKSIVPSKYVVTYGSMKHKSIFLDWLSFHLESHWMVTVLTFKKVWGYFQDTSHA